MPTEDDQPQSVNDISHLFLSNVRSVAGQGMPRPQRKPPGAHSLPADSQPQAERSHASSHAGMSDEAGIPSVDLTPEEYAHVFGPTGKSAAHPAAASIACDDIAPVTALLASHLGMRQLERAREYARHVAASGQRVGLIDLDASEFRLYCIDPAVEPGAEAASRQNVTTGVCDPRQIAEAIEELNVDVERWLLLLPNLRTPEAKAILRDCDAWTLLSTCDHDGVVSAYRTLKGVCDARVGKSPRLAVTTLDAAGDAEANRVQQKLAGVCRQFLSLDPEPETPVRYAGGVAEHPLMNCRVTRDKAQLASSPHWTVVAEMLKRPRRGQTIDAISSEQEGKVPASVIAKGKATPDASDAIPANAINAATVEPHIRRVEPQADVAARGASVMPSESLSMDFTMPRLAVPVPQMSPGTDDVIELSGDATNPAGILAAVLHRSEFGMVETPVAIPGCPAAKLVVTRERGLAVVAAATRGLKELRSIGKAFQWMNENRALVAMAVPQLSIDASKTPSVILLVDQADITGELLRPMMQAEHVTVRAYRTLRWAGRQGLLLEAA